MFNRRKRKLDKLEEVVRFANYVTDEKSKRSIAIHDHVLKDLREAIAEVASTGELDDELLAALEQAKAAERILSDVIAAEHKAAIHALDAELALKHREADQRLRPCARCQSEHFLVRDRIEIETRSQDLDVKMIVCSQCGDVRFECPSPALLRDWIEGTFFRRVNIPTDNSGPFR